MPVFMVVGFAHGDLPIIEKEAAGEGKLCPDLIKIITKNVRRLQKSFDNNRNKKNGKLNL